MKLHHTLVVIGLVLANALWAQRPQEILLDEDPFDFGDPIKLVFIVILPLILLIAGWIWVKKRRQKNSNN